jgi:hypothetical protein
MSMSSTSPKPRFSEAMWFRHGEQEEAAAQVADTEGDAAVAPAHTLPIEDRYHDDGSMSAAEQARWSLRTGRTEPLPILADGGARKMEISDRELLGVDARARVWMIALGVVAVIAILVGVTL